MMFVCLICKYMPETVSRYANTTWVVMHVTKVLFKCHFMSVHFKVVRISK